MLTRAQRKLKYIEDFSEEIERLNWELTAYKDMYKISLNEIKSLAE